MTGLLILLGLLGGITLLDLLLVKLSPRDADGSIPPSGRAVEAIAARLQPGIPGSAGEPPHRLPADPHNSAGRLPTRARAGRRHHGTTAPRRRAMADCPHANTTNHALEEGTEVVTWTTCDDCNAVTASSRRSKYGRPRR